jgi:Fe-S cluster assembly iron-binding protein IscA
MHSKTLAMEHTGMLTLTDSAQRASGRFVSGAETPVQGLRIPVTGGSRGFKFSNPNATASCGCGNSFSA